MIKDNIEFYYTQPQSTKSQLLKLVLKLTRLKQIMKHFSESRILINLISRASPTRSLKQMARIDRELINGKNVFTLYPKKNASETIILYLHGGAFAINFTRPHWNFIAALIQENHCCVVAPDFPLLPSDYKARLDVAYRVYNKILKTTDSKNIILMGDSSGGNMALALAQLLPENEKPAPAQVILLSPWLDVSMSNPVLKTNFPNDPILSYEAAIKVGKAHAGIADTKFYQASPMYGKLKGIGKISLFTGTDDILNPDARKLKALANEQQIDFNYFEYTSMVHAWMLFGLPESQLVKKQIASLINPSPQNKFMDTILSFLTGTWFICSSNFPMWTKGDKHDPIFHYEIVTHTKDNSILSDEVSYIKNGKTKTIKGYDTQSRTDPTTFVWRGKGLLKLLSSKWKVALKDEQNGKWAVIYFSKTLFTPEGVDIISREVSLSKETWEQIKLEMYKDPLLAKHIPQIKELRISNNTSR